MAIENFPDTVELRRRMAAVLEGHCPLDNARLQRLPYEAVWGPRGQWALCPTCGNKWRASSDGEERMVDRLGQRILVRGYE